MASWIRKGLASALAGMLFIYGTPGFAATAEGELLSIAPKGPGLWQVVIKAGEEKQTYIVSLKTLIKKEIPVEEVRPGDHLVKPKTGQGVPGFKGIKAPFGNMSPGAKKALGLPDIPNVPAIPQVPKIPSKEQLKAASPAAGAGGPQIPSKEQLKSGSPAPGGQASAGPAPGAGPGPGAGPAAGEPGPQEGPSGPGGRKPDQPEPKVKTQDDILEEKGFQNEKLLFAPGSEAARPGVEVVSVKKKDKGYEVSLAGGKENKLTVEAGNKVLKALLPAELKEKDRVRLEFQEQGKVVTDLLVQ